MNVPRSRGPSRPRSGRGRRGARDDQHRRGPEHDTRDVAARPLISSRAVGRRCSRRQPLVDGAARRSGRRVRILARKIAPRLTPSCAIAAPPQALPANPRTGPRRHRGRRRRRGHRRAAAPGAHAAQARPRGAAAAVEDDPDADEQASPQEPVGGDDQRRAREARGGEQADSGQRDADLADRDEREQTLEVGLGEAHDRADQRGERSSKPISTARSPAVCDDIGFSNTVQ